MRMENSPHPGRLVKENIEEMGLSVAKAAEGVGVTRQQLYKVVNCESAISPEMAVRLERLSAARPMHGSGCKPLTISPRCASMQGRSSCVVSRRSRHVDHHDQRTIVTCKFRIARAQPLRFRRRIKNIKQQEYLIVPTPGIIPFHATLYRAPWTYLAQASS